MNLIFDDNGLHKKLAPITLTRPVSEIRFGIDTITETWTNQLKKHFDVKNVSHFTEGYLSEKYPASNAIDGLRIAGNVKPDPALISLVSKLKAGEELKVNGIWIASFGIDCPTTIEENLDSIIRINDIWDLFQKLDHAIKLDFEYKTANRTSEIPSNTNQISRIQNIFIEEGAKVEFATLNASTGPIYIGKDAEIMEGSLIRGPFALGEGATLKMGAKIYGATSIGKHCKVGGEVSNCLFQAYSNKGHDGFLGNSVLGEWCNLGADTNSSNLKNNYGKIKIHSYETNQLEPTDNIFCGLLMGDHSKTGINTMLNTATVVGVSANIFGGGFPDKYIPSFTWGGVNSNDKFVLEKAFEVGTNMMSRRKVQLSITDKNILEYIYNDLA